MVIEKKQKVYKKEYDWVGKVVTCNCKKLKFHHYNKWFMHKIEPVPESEMNKIPLDTEIQTDHPIKARRLDLILIYKKKPAMK